MSHEHDVNFSSDGQQQRRHTAVITQDRNRHLEGRKSDLRSLTGTQGVPWKCSTMAQRAQLPSQCCESIIVSKNKITVSASDRNVLSSVTSLKICKKPSIKVTLWQENGRRLDVNNIYSDMFYDPQKKKEQLKICSDIKEVLRERNMWLLSVSCTAFNAASSSKQKYRRRTFYIRYMFILRSVRTEPVRVRNCDENNPDLSLLAYTQRCHVHDASNLRASSTPPYVSHRSQRGALMEPSAVIRFQ